MVRLHNALKSVVLWLFGGAVYFLCEVIFKSVTGRPQSISWTMLVLAAIICIPLDRANEAMGWDTPLWQQAVAGGLCITAAELGAGMILNCWLGLGIWDYGNCWGNLWGQICPKWTLIWCCVAAVGIVVFDWLRWLLWPEDEQKPDYRWKAGARA